MGRSRWPKSTASREDSTLASATFRQEPSRPARNPPSGGRRGGAVRRIWTGPEGIGLENVIPNRVPLAVFRDWVEPVRLVRWWAPVADIDARLHGRFELSWPQMGWHLRGDFLDFDPGARGGQVRDDSQAGDVSRSEPGWVSRHARSPPSHGERGSGEGRKTMEIELTQCRVFLGVNRSPTNTWPRWAPHAAH
jgi:hypothetical protein